MVLLRESIMKQQLLKEIELGSKNALIKKRIITHYIYNGSSTITDLSKELDLSIPTVTKFIGEMYEDGYINDYGKLETSGGRHPSLYGLKLYPDSGLTRPDILMLIFSILSVLTFAFFMKELMSLHSSSFASGVFSNLYGIFIFNSIMSPLKLIRPILTANLLMSTPIKYPDSGFRPYRLGCLPPLVSSLP